jgi:hypothetical protein
MNISRETALPASFVNSNFPVISTREIGFELLFPRAENFQSLFVTYGRVQITDITALKGNFEVIVHKSVKSDFSTNCPI